MHPAAQPLEDELGDVLEKAMRLAGLNEHTFAAKVSICRDKIQDALDYRYDFSPEEIKRLAAALSLNEVGLQAIADARYPLPTLPVLPFELRTLSMPYGVGTVNAFLIRHPRTRAAILIDTGNCSQQLGAHWPTLHPHLDAAFITHWDCEHCAAIDWVVHDCMGGEANVYGPRNKNYPWLRLPKHKTPIELGGFVITTFETPCRGDAHFVYRVACQTNPEATSVLFTGDLLFAGSIGGDFCCPTLLPNIRSLLAQFPPNTLIAPGHGPLTSLAHERQLNAFLG